MIPPPCVVPTGSSPPNEKHVATESGKIFFFFHRCTRTHRSYYDYAVTDIVFRRTKSQFYFKVSGVFSPWEMFSCSNADDVRNQNFIGWLAWRGGSQQPAVPCGRLHPCRPAVCAVFTGQRLAICLLAVYWTVRGAWPYHIDTNRQKVTQQA